MRGGKGEGKGKGEEEGPRKITKAIRRERMRRRRR